MTANPTIPTNPAPEPAAAFPRVEMLHDGTILLQLWSGVSPTLFSVDAARALYSRLGAMLGAYPEQP